MPVLRIIVLGLLLANILLIAFRVLQPDAGDGKASAEIDPELTELPRIELADDALPPDDDTEAQTSVGFRDLVTASGSDVHGCIRFGPFESESELQALQPDLQKLFDAVHARVTNSLVESGYWVFLPPHSTRPEAEQTMEQLTAAGARDLYVVPRGNLVNAVSLGIYDSRDRAESRREQIAGLDPGLNIAIQLQTEIETRLWLEAGPVDALNPVLIQLSLNHPDVQQMQIRCPDDMAESQQMVNGDSVPSDSKVQE
jgi:hypothetical protein